MLRPRVAVILASAGRPALLADTVESVRCQNRAADHVVVVVPGDDSLPEGSRIEGCTVVYDVHGLASQRNAGMGKVPDADYYFFFDDDALLHPEYIQRAVGHFDRDPTIVGLTGNVLLDGAASTAIERDRAERALTAANPGLTSAATRPVGGLYGCNFVVRNSPDRPDFDDRLPLYSWLEDRDFSNRLARTGRLVRVQDCMIVHLGAKSGGRMAHVRLGYTQVMNPAYFLRKRSFGRREALWEVLRPAAKNVVGSIRGDEVGWRRKRLRGNLHALSLVLRGRFEPERMKEFD